MNFGIISKKCKNVIIILLIGTILLPYFSGTNIAKADNISDYKNAIKYDACRQFYAENCTYMNDLGDTVQKRKDKLDSWANTLNTTEETDIYYQFVTLNSACLSLEDLSYEEYHKKVDQIMPKDATRMCLSFLNITAPIKEVEIPSDDSGEFDRCPVEAVQTFTFWDALNHPADALLAGIPKLLTSLLTFVIKIMARVLQLFIMPNNSVTVLTFIGRWSPNSGYTGYSTNNQFVVESWEMMRDIANMMIMIMIFIIAMGIMLGNKEFQNYQALIYLVIVALLINFSLVICGMLIDISNYFTVFFLHNGGIENLECTLVMTIRRVSNIFQIGQPKWWQKLIILFTKTSPAHFILPLMPVAHFMDKMIYKVAGIEEAFPMAMTVSSILGLIVATILCGQIIGLCIYVLTRIITLWALNIVSPLAMACWILPQTREVFNAWWKYFSGLLLNLPLLCAALFFILRLIYLISDQANEAMKSAGGSLSMSTVIGYTMMIIILAQSMLIAASALNVNNISKITKKTREIIQGGVGAGLKWVKTEGTKRVEKSEAYQATATQWAQSKNPTLAKLGFTMGQRHKEAIKKDLEAGEKEISKIDKKNAAIMAQTAKRLFESPSPLTNDKTKAFQVMTDIMNGIQKYDYELDDILKIYPNYLKDIASLSQDPRYANLDVVDDIKKWLPYLKFKKTIDGKGYTRASVEGTMKEFGLDVNKIKAVNLDALYKFLSTNVDENGKPLIDSLITFYQSATSNAKTTSALFSKTKPQYMNEFIEKRNKELAPLGKTFFGIMGEEGYKKITHESMAGQLFEWLSDKHKEDFKQAFQDKQYIINSPKFDSIINDAVSSIKTKQPGSKDTSGGIPEEDASDYKATQLLLKILEELKEMKIFMRPNKEPLTNFAKYVNKIESKVGNFDDFIKKQLKSNKLTEEQKNTLNTATNIAEISKLLAMSQPQTITDDDKLNTYINKLQNAIKEVLKNTTVPLLPEIINKLQNINVPSKQSNMFLLVMANQVLPQAKENELHNFFNNIPDDQKHSLYQQLNTEYSKINKTSLTETQGFKDLKYHNPILYNKIIGKT